MLNPERSINNKISERVSEEYFAFLKHNFGIELVQRNCCCDDDPYPTCIAYAFSSTGKLIMRGNGKGDVSQSRLSALYELIERLYDDPFFLSLVTKWDGVEFVETNQIITKYQQYFNNTPVFQNFINNKYAIAYPCRLVKTQNDAFYLPLFMFGPDYPMPHLIGKSINSSLDQTVYGKIKPREFEVFFPGDSLENYIGIQSAVKYSSTNGQSAGLDFDETLVHALNEVIERETFAQFLLNNKKEINFSWYSNIDKSTITDENILLLKYIETKYGISIFLSDISCNLGIPTVIAYTDHKDYDAWLVNGMGTSIDIDYAIQRSLLELKQCLDLNYFDDSLPKSSGLGGEWLVNSSVPAFFKDVYFFNAASFSSIKEVDLATIRSNYQKKTVHLKGRMKMKQLKGELKKWVMILYIIKLKLLRIQAALSV